MNAVSIYYISKMIGVDLSKERIKMAVEIKLISQPGEDPVFEAVDLSTQEPVVAKMWFEKSKDKWHILLAQNSANRKYVSLNEFNTKNSNGVYLLVDNTKGPRTLGTAQPDKKLVPYMTAEDKEKYDAIIARAIENRDAQKAQPLTEEEKLEAAIAKLAKRLEEKRATVTTENKDIMTSDVPAKKGGRR